MVTLSTKIFMLWITLNDFDSQHDFKKMSHRKENIRISFTLFIYSKKEQKFVSFVLIKSNMLNKYLIVKASAIICPFYSFS